MDFSTLLTEIGISGMIDIAFTAVLIYSLLIWLRRTRRAASVVSGILIVALIYLLARQFDMALTVAVLQGFFTVILIALLIIFQEELRYLFERIAAWSLGGQFRIKLDAPAQSMLAEVLSRTLTDLSRERIGALVVLRGHDPLVRHLDGGELLGGQVSESILKSLFDPSSMGHDGAVVIEGGRITMFGAHLPLTRNPPTRMGTRHAAGLGLSEHTDALCIVVSEERGTISVARYGQLHPMVGDGELEEVIRNFLREMAPRKVRSGWTQWITRNPRQKVFSVALALALWFVLVHESRTMYRTYRVPVEFGHLPDEMKLVRVEPQEIEVTFSAPRKTFYFVRPAKLKSAIRTWDVDPGRNQLAVTPADLQFPQSLVLENIRPREITVEVAQERNTDDEISETEP